MQIVKQIIKLLSTTFPFQMNGNLKLKQKRRENFAGKKVLFVKHAQLIVRWVESRSEEQEAADVKVFLFIPFAESLMVNW